jgi:hypothetical protein
VLDVSEASVTLLDGSTRLACRSDRHGEDLDRALPPVSKAAGRPNLFKQVQEGSSRELI